MRVRGPTPPEMIPGNISEIWVAAGLPGTWSRIISLYIFRLLLASLNIEATLQEPAMYRRQERLNKMIDGLGLEDIYGAMIEWIKAQGGVKSRLGMRALMPILLKNHEDSIPER